MFKDFEEQDQSCPIFVIIKEEFWDPNDTFITLTNWVEDKITWNQGEDEKEERREAWLDIHIGKLIQWH